MELEIKAMCKCGSVVAEQTMGNIDGNRALYITMHGHAIIEGETVCIGCDPSSKPMTGEELKALFDEMMEYIDNLPPAEEVDLKEKYIPCPVCNGHELGEIDDCIRCTECMCKIPEHMWNARTEAPKVEEALKVCNKEIEEYKEVVEDFKATRFDVSLIVDSLTKIRNVLEG